jgi:hypothetical protein
VKPHVFHPEAAEEYAASAGYYQEIDPLLGGGYHDEVERSIRKIRRQPDRYPQLDPPARRALLHRFPYAVVYLDQPDRV